MAGQVEYKSKLTKTMRNNEPASDEARSLPTALGALCGFAGVFGQSVRLFVSKCNKAFSDSYVI